MRMLVTKAASVLCVVVMVTVVFQQVQLAGGPANVGGGYGTDSMEDWESSRPVTLSSGDSVAPSAQAIGNGIVHLAWIDTRTGSGAVYYKKSTDGGETFTSDRRISEAGSQPEEPSISVSEDGKNVAVGWDAMVEVENRSGRAVLFRESTDGGSSFGKTTFVTFGSSPQVRFYAGDMILSFLQEDLARGSTYLRTLRVPAGMKTQGPANDLLTFDTSASSLKMTIEGNMVHIIWDEWMQGRETILHSSIELNSGRVEGAHLVAIPSGTLAPGSMTLTARNRRVVVAWSETKDGVSGVSAARSGDMGEHWGSVIAITDMKSNAANPSVMTNSTGVLAVVWQDDLKGPWQLYWRMFKDLGVPLSPATRITFSRADATMPSMAVDGQDNIYLFWQDRMGGSTSVYMDGDLSLRRPIIGSVMVYAGRLSPSAYSPPEQQSRAEFLDLLRDLRSSIMQSEEQTAASKIRNYILPRMDGSLGGDPIGDLLVDPKAQVHLAWSFRLMLRELDPDTSGSGRTRSGGYELSAEEPLPPDTQFSYTNYAPVFNITVSDITSTTAKVSWETDPPNAYATWLNWGTNTTMGNQVFAQPGNPWNVTLTSLEANTTYYYGIQAVLQTTPPPPMYVAYDSFYTGVLIEEVRYAILSASEVTVYWKTNLPSTSVVWYNTTEAYGLTETGDNDAVHFVNITDLDPRQTYHFEVESVALADAILSAKSADSSFTTHLEILNLTVKSSGFTDGSYHVTLTWNTTRNATSEVRYGNTTLYGLQSNGTQGLVHNATLWNLSSATSYAYQARSVGLDNENDSDAMEGETLATPPISVYNITVETTTDSATVDWETNYNGTSMVRCGLTENYTNNQTGSGLTEHEVTFYDLSTATTYHFRVESNSSTNANDTAIGLDRTFTTKGIVVSSVQVSNINTTGATITWQTNANGTSLVRYGLNSIWESTKTGSNATSHSIILLGLLPDTQYVFRVESSSVSNVNDTNMSIHLPFQTVYAPNDAGSGIDAGGTIGLALLTEPGSYTGKAGTTDTSDYYRFKAFQNETIKIHLIPTSFVDLDLYMYGPDSNQKASSRINGYGAPETITFTATASGAWYLEVRWVRGNGVSSGYYSFTFNVTGGGPQHLLLDVGSQQTDGDLAINLPGFSLALSSGWSNPATSTTTSYATFWNMNPNNKPVYRSTVVNSTFYLNVYRHSPEKYTDWLVTLQYYSSEDIVVALYNGAGWVNVTTVPGKTNWWTWNFVLEHTLFYDYLPSSVGINVALRFSGTIWVDMVSAVAYGYTTYVGHGSDDGDALYHSPGILTGTGWSDVGGGYKNGANCSELVMNIPDTSATYNVDFRFKGDIEKLYVDQYNGNYWIRLATLVSFGMDNYFNTNQTAYYDAYPSIPGMNIRVRFVATAINEFTYASTHMVRWFDEVGATGDNYLWLHDPGMSLYPNGQWGSIVAMDGRQVRYGQRDAEVYLNAPLMDYDYTVYITYKATSSGQVKQRYGDTYLLLGEIEGDSQWYTGVFRTNRTQFRDYYGSDQLNIVLHFTIDLYLDRMWAEPVVDGDHTTEYGQTQSGPEGTPPTGSLPLTFNFPVYESGTFAFYGNSQLTFVGKRHEEKSQTFAINNTNVYELSMCGSTDNRLDDTCLDTKKQKTFTFSFSFQVSLKAGPKTVKAEGSGKILEWHFVRLTTDPDTNDADGDGLLNYEETGTHHTDPNKADTDGDGLTDFDEAKSFNYQDHSANGFAANATFNITVEAFARYGFSVNTDATVSGPSVSAQVYLDGQLKGNKSSTVGWTGYAFTFVASLAKGLHSLQVQMGTGTGNVHVHDVAANNVNATSPVRADSDLDGLGDGDEVKGATGFYTDPMNPDSDGDHWTDGNEMTVTHTDPTNRDTDGDGTWDSKDLDPLHDLIVQVWLKELWIQGQLNLQYYSEVGVNGQFTRSVSSAGSDPQPRSNHYISVNVPDDKNRKTATVVIRAFDNVVPRNELDLTPNPNTLSLVIDFGVLTNIFDGASAGTGDHYGLVYYEVRTVKFGKVNTVLMTPNDWSTVLNSSVGTLHRFAGEQRFAVLNVNVADAAGAEAYWNTQSAMTSGADKYFADITGHSHTAIQRTSSGDIVVTHGWLGNGILLDESKSQYLEVPHDPKLDFSSEMTVSFWIKPSKNYDSSCTSSDWEWAIGKDDGWWIGYYCGQVEGLKFQVYEDTNTQYEVTSPFTLAAGSWYHIAGVYDGTSVTLHIVNEQNGNHVVQSNPTGSFELNRNDNMIRIGQLGSHYIYGVLDEINLYARALRSDEIEAVNERILDLDMDTRTSSAWMTGFRDLSGHGNDAFVGGGNFTSTNAITTEGQRGLAVQMINGAHLYTQSNMGADVNVLTLSARLFWKGGSGMQTVAVGRGTISGVEGPLYSLDISGPSGSIVYGLRLGSVYWTVNIKGITLPPNQWHTVTLTYDGYFSTAYLDGEKIDSQTWSPVFLPHPVSSYLCIFGCAGDSPFNGYIDDLTLWNRSLGQGEIRAMNYLDRGLNGIVVPRGLFFQSQFFSNLNTTTFSQSSPVVGSTVMGNDNPGELNARTIQQLIAANLTLAAAWTWIQELMTANDTGSVTSFPIVVTGEVYTLGFDRMVLNVLANMTVQNSGNSSEPPPPIREPTFWESAWNSFTGLLSAAWNAVVAVATFVANVALAVIRWCIDFAVAIANGEGLQFFYDTVVKPFVDAVMAFIKFIIDLIVGAITLIINTIVKPIADALMAWGGEIVAQISRALSDPNAVLSVFTNTLASILLASGVFFAFLGLLAGLSIIETITKPLLGLVADAIAFVVRILAVVVVVALIGLSIPKILGQQTTIPPEVDGAMTTSFTVSEFAIALGMSLALVTRSLESLKAFALVSLAVSLVGISLLLVRECLLKGNDRTTYIKRLFVDSGEIGLALYSQLGMKSPPMTRQWYKILDAVDDALGWIALGWGFLDLTEDISGCIRAPG